MIADKKHNRLYRIWCGMKGRCQNPNRPKYSIYGARGISVCDEWQNFSNFRKWSMENGYRDDLTIDRIDNNGNYCPENCRWATSIEQNHNRSCSLNVIYKGKMRSVPEIASEVGMDYYLLRSRLKRGMDIESAINMPRKTHKQQKKVR